ncbi:class I adenylate-forming enzyme family protein [Nocardia nova]|uniref:class I adenylate-forming enzyme family protein n=1 Tax=Nocardia nova TaxID=37330 RepID=UPI0007A4AB40|nr:AMP-binding protein [Nocardia nova]
MSSRESLADFVRFWGRAIPTSDAIIEGDNATTWAELDERTSRLANGLRARGIAKGDRIGLLAPNCREYLEIVIAGFKLGAITVPLNFRLTAKELDYIIRNSGCSLVISAPAHVAVAAEAVAGEPEGADIRRVGFEPGFGEVLSSLYSEDVTDLDTPIASDDVAFICYTSGTTGNPKGAMLTHGNVLATAHYRNLADDLGQNDRLYLPAPLAFTGTLVMLWAVAYVGGGLTVLDTVSDARRSLEAIQRHKISHFTAVPVIWEGMLSDPDFARFDLSSLRTCLTGGAAVSEAFLQRMWAAGIPVRNAYGLTEGASSTTWQSFDDAREHPQSVGRAGIHNRIRVVDPVAEPLVDMPTGEVGEVMVKGPEVMLGYWADPSATTATLIDGWLKTGDLGYLDRDGYLYIAGRSKDMFISGGLNVYPAEIEEVLARIPGVVECAVIGVDDEKWGETAAAIIHLSEDAHLEPIEIRSYCKSQLADYKLPRYVVFRPSPLPRNMSGKILKWHLAEEYSEPASLGAPLR